MENRNLVLTEYVALFHVLVYYWQDRGLGVGRMQQSKWTHQSSDTASNQSLHPRFPSLPQTDTSSLIEPSDNPISTSLSNHKNALQRVTNYRREQPIDIDPNTILHNSLITNNYFSRTSM
jgi:hypothetical protein